MDMKTKLPNIYEYTDFRIFLNKYQKTRYSFDKQFSRIRICKLLGIPKSRSYFSDVINGKKVTDTFIERFINVFELKSHEALYFRTLVLFNQATTIDERNAYFDHLITLNRSPKRILNKDTYEYFKEWYHSVIRAMLDIYDIKKNVNKIGSMLIPKISERKVQQSIELMKKLGLIAHNKEGFLKPVEKNLFTGTYANDEIIKTYQRQCLKLAEAALCREEKHCQTITTKMISVSPQGYNMIEERLQKFLQEISSIVHTDDQPADRVLHLDLQLFPGAIIKKDLNNE